MDCDADVLIAGAGPAGAATAIFLAQAGWHVLLMEQHVYPRHKVCGECVSAGALAVIDALGLGVEFRERAGPQLRKLGWVNANTFVTANMPAGVASLYRYGHAIGRHTLDAMLVERARAVGVQIIQPGRLRAIAGVLGHFRCEYQIPTARACDLPKSHCSRTLHVPLVIDALGSGEQGRELLFRGPRAPRNPSDLLAFKARFRNSKLPEGCLPLIALSGGYGGMVVADEGRMTLACCVRRDLLDRCRERAPGEPAGVAIEAHLRDSSSGVRAALEGAQQEGPWISVGPVSPGMRLASQVGVFRVGNAAGETHPLIGEGIGMALQSAQLLANCLTRAAVVDPEAQSIAQVHRGYAIAWRRQFAVRIRLSRVCAALAMRPTLAACAGSLLRCSPRLLTVAARLAGKSRAPVSVASPPRKLE